MSRSNSYNFNLTRDGLITAAYQLANIYTSEDTLSVEDRNLGVLLLNAMVKDWEVDGIHLWKRRQAILFPQKASYSYACGSTGDNITNSYVSTTISADEALGQTTLSITSSTGITQGDYIGIELDDGTRQWTTVASVPGATSVIVNDALTDSATADNSVIAYTTKINRPLRILRATTYNLHTGAETVLANLSYDEYFNMPLKTTAGSPNNFYYDKLLDNGVLYLFPNPTDVDVFIKFTYDDAIMDLDNPNDDFDFPQEWFMTLLYCLTVELMYSLKMFAELEKFEAKAERLKARAKQWDADEESLKLLFKTRNGI